jgi:hypothetical protein
MSQFDTLSPLFRETLLDMARGLQQQQKSESTVKVTVSPELNENTDAEEITATEQK